MFAVSTFFCGCNDKTVCNDLANLPSFELSGRIQGEIPISKEPKKLMDLSRGDVVVAVNGAALTREMFESILAIKSDGLSKERLSSHEINKHLEEFAKNYMNFFVAQRLIVDAALCLGTVTTNEVEEHVAETVEKIAASRKIDTKTLIASFGRLERYYKYDMAVSYIVNKFVKENVPPAVKVDDLFVKAVRDQINIERAAAMATNDIYKLQMQQWRNDIVAGKVLFESIAEKHPPEVGEFANGTDGEYVGEFAKGEIGNPQIEAFVFNGNEGDISDIIEDDATFQVLKIEKIIAPITSTNRSAVVEEKRRVAAIELQKEPLPVDEDHETLVHDLEGQMQVQAVNSYLTNLVTNGANVVVYPFGKNVL